MVSIIIVLCDGAVHCQGGERRQLNNTVSR